LFGVVSALRLVCVGVCLPWLRCCYVVPLRSVVISVYFVVRFGYGSPLVVLSCLFTHGWLTYIRGSVVVVDSIVRRLFVVVGCFRLLRVGVFEHPFVCYVGFVG